VKKQWLCAASVLIATASLVQVHAQVQRLNTETAKDHVGEVATVCGHVTGYACSVDEGTSLFFASSDNRPGAPRFRARIPYADRDKFGRNPEDQYFDRLVCGLGVIRERRGGHEIVVPEERALTSLPDRPELPPFEPDVPRPCDPGVQLPKVKKEVKPAYTADALQRRVTGTVTFQAVVDLEGKIRRFRALRSLDDGLDVSAARALQGWEFVPGTLQGKPTPVVVVVDLMFTIRK